MKGIILAGGHGTRLYPITKVVSKQLLPIFDKPLIFYPLSTLMLASIKEILIISTPQDTPRFEKLLGNGKKLGISISYAVQNSPKGLADAFILGKKFIGDDDVCLILGDNIFFGNELIKILRSSVNISQNQRKAVLLGYHVKYPQKYGVFGFDDDGNVNSIIEKPSKPLSNYAVVGLYFYPNDVINISKNLTPSNRGELEITDVNKVFLEKGKLDVKLMGRGNAWFDTGSYEDMNNATNFIKTIYERQGQKIACLEEIAFNKSFITNEELEDLANEYPNEYGDYLKSLI